MRGSSPRMTEWGEGWLPSKLRVSLGIHEAVDALCGGEGEFDRHQLAGRRRQAVLRRVAMQMRAIGVGDDQASLSWENLAWKVLREGKEQPVAMRAVVLPFLVGAQVLQR